jgi:hypothetical protein
MKRNFDFFSTNKLLESTDNTNDVPTSKEKIVKTSTNNVIEYFKSSSNKKLQTNVEKKEQIPTKIISESSTLSLKDNISLSSKTDIPDNKEKKIKLTNIFSKNINRSAISQSNHTLEKETSPLLRLQNEKDNRFILQKKQNENDESECNNLLNKKNINIIETQEENKDTDDSDIDDSSSDDNDNEDDTSLNISKDDDDIEEKKCNIKNEKTLKCEIVGKNAKELSQYFTSPDVARFCIEKTHALLKNGFNDFDYVIEPSSGTGAFVDQLNFFIKNKKQLLFFDIDSKSMENRADFLIDNVVPKIETEVEIVKTTKKTITSFRNISIINSRNTKTINTTKKQCCLVIGKQRCAVLLHFFLTFLFMFYVMQLHEC